jgi:ABC-type transport system substrate-binding protein
MTCSIQPTRPWVVYSTAGKGKTMRGPWQIRKTGAWWWLALVLGVLVASGWLAGKVVAAGLAGSELMGKLEGPEGVTDPAKFPKSFKEAPQLAALVKAGKLSPVQERVSQDPLVIKPVRETGKYGGTWRRGFSGPADFWNGYRCCGHDKILFWDYTGTKVIPNVAKGWEVSSDGRTFTVFLRKGMKWSDGHPFTADDFMFWYEDIGPDHGTGHLDPLRSIPRLAVVD